jgi:hypothetical protein
MNAAANRVNTPDALVNKGDVYADLWRTGTYAQEFLVHAVVAEVEVLAGKFHAVRSSGNWTHGG